MNASPETGRAGEGLKTEAEGRLANGLPRIAGVDDFELYVQLRRTPVSRGDPGRCGVEALCHEILLTL